MENTKMTNSMALANAIATLQNIEGYDVEVIEKLEKIKASIDKKNTNRTPSKKTLANRSENERLAQILVDFMRGREPMTIAQIVEEVAEFNGFTSSKVSSLMKIARENGYNIAKTIVKKSNLYQLIED
mgnify:FL=1